MQTGQEGRECGLESNDYRRAISLNTTDPGEILKMRSLNYYEYLLKQRSREDRERDCKVKQSLVSG